MSEPDFRKMGDPMNDRLPPNDNLLNRRRRKDLARIVGPRTLDGENVCTRCGVPDVHCQCDDRIDYDAQFDEGTARDDYDIRPIWASDRLGQIIDQHHVMCDEIDHLRAESAAFRDLAGCCSDCEWEGVEIVHRPMCARWQSAEIAEVADRIANGHATCGATELRRIVKKIGLLHAERERLILKAHQEGASLREIAEILEVNHVTVRNALQKLSWRLANEKPPDDKEGSTGTG